MSRTVTFKRDVFPYVRGDVVTLEDEELKRVDQTIKARNWDDVYVSGNKQVGRTVDGGPGADRQRALDARTAAVENNELQAATLQAQRDSVAEPANVDALGIAPEAPAQTVTGTKPADVGVKNPQEVTDLGNDAEPEVKKSNKK
jgi:hypothetical protein